jgi:hypothetical protein
MTTCMSRHVRVILKGRYMQKIVFGLKAGKTSCNTASHR